MFKNVLVGVEGGPHGRDAVALASRVIESGGKLTLVNVFSGAARPIDAVTPGMVEEDRARARKVLEETRAGAGVEAELLPVDAMTAGEGLHLAAEELGADLIVVGSSRRGAFKRVLLGDDTRAALNGAPSAVAIAPAGYRDNAAPIRKIGVAYDGSPESLAALAAARDLAGATDASVLALRVVSVSYYEYMGMMAPSGGGIDEIVKSADAEMKALPGVEGRAEYGLAGEELAAFSGEVDLLIVGSRNYGPARRLMVGSTSNHLQRHARGPLLILPRGTAHAKPADQPGGQAASAAVSA
jgi:nucleotide-binding universal stress UspA family protein